MHLAVGQPYRLPSYEGLDRKAAQAAAWLISPAAAVEVTGAQAARAAILMVLPMAAVLWAARAERP